MFIPLITVQNPEPAAPVPSPLSTSREEALREVDEEGLLFWDMRSEMVLGPNFRFPLALISLLEEEGYVRLIEPDEPLPGNTKSTTAKFVKA